MFARIGVMQALNGCHVREFNPKQKEPHWGRRSPHALSSKVLERYFIMR